VAETDFHIDYKGQQVKVSSNINGGNIFFVVHLKTPVTIAEGLNNEDTWCWYEVGKGITVLSTELGELIEGVDS
jgi:hypothetical protein